MSCGWFVLTLSVVMCAAQPDERSKEYAKRYYDNRSVIVVEREGDIVDRLPCERIPLDYPELKGRAEGHAAIDSKGNIYAAVGYNVGGKGAERFFRSQDQGRTWTSHILTPTDKNRYLAAFTLLHNDTLLMVLNGKCEEVEVWSSHDRGESWQRVTTLSAAPLKCIGEGTMSLTQLADGRLLFPVGRYVHPEKGLVLDKLLLWHSLYVSTDGGNTFPVAYSTFPDSCESHILELHSGRLLGTFRYQRMRRPEETDDEIRALGGYLGGPRHPKEKRTFKNIFLGDSDDGGVTWKNFRPVRDRDGQPLVRFGQVYGRLIQVPDGRVVLVHDNRQPGEQREVLARISRDSGQTWGREVYHLSLGRGYPSSVVLRDGTIVTVTGNTPSNSRSMAIARWRAQVVRWRLP